MDYYILFGGQQTGPFSLEQLKKMAEAEEIKKETYLCREGMSQWVAAKDMEELASVWKTEGSASEEVQKDSSVKDANKIDKKTTKKKPMIILTAIVGCIVLLIGVFNLIFGLTKDEKAQVDRVEQAIFAIGNIMNDDGERISLAEELYGQLSEKCRRHVKGYQVLEDARSTYDEIRSDYVENLINLIGTVSDNSLEAIQTARNEYDRLEEQQKGLVDNRSVLDEAEAAYDQMQAEKVIELINELNEIDRYCGEKIEHVQEAYDLLTDAQKGYVSNYSVLEAAPERYRQSRIQHVEEQIALIGEVTVESGGTIALARSAYEALEEDEKEEVDNYAVLEDAENDISEMKIALCIELIDSIGEVTRDSGEAIRQAREAFNDLVYAERTEITNISTLLSAERDYEYITVLLRTGETVSGRGWEVTLKRTTITGRILPDRTSGYYWYKSAPEGQVFLDMVFTLKNTSSSSQHALNVFDDCTLQYGANTYNKSYTVYNTVGYSVDEVYSWEDGIGALNSHTLHVVLLVPSSCQTDDKSLDVHLEILGDERIIHFK